MEITKEIIDEAKKVAKDDYDNYMKSIHCHNPEYKRKWIRHDKPEHNMVAYALEGTPDKAFVFVYKDERVVAKRTSGETIKEWKV